MSLSSDFQLQQVTIHTRHGARAPMYDVLSDFSWWNQNYAAEELTTVGQRQHYLLGVTLKKQYSNILPYYLDEKLIRVYSTSSPRAVRSAQSFMLGMFPKNSPVKQRELSNLDFSLPPGYNDEYLKNIIKLLGNKKLPHNHQTFPQLAPMENTDNLLSPEDVCERIDLMRKNAFQDQQYHQFEENLWSSGFYERFVRVFQQQLDRKGINSTSSALNMTVVGWFYDSLVCSQFEGLTLPDKLDESLMKEILFVYDFQNVWKNFPSSEAVKLLASQHARQIIQDIDQLLSKDSYNRLQLYSGHDGDVNTMLQFLGLQIPSFDFKNHESQDEFITHTNAPFASSIIFELYQNKMDDSYSIQTIYNGNVQHLRFCINSLLCSVEEFRSYFLNNSYSKEEWTTQCIIKEFSQLEIEI